MSLGGGSEAAFEVEAVIELHGDADGVDAEWDEDSVWLRLKFGLDEPDVGAAEGAAVAAVLLVVVILADVEAEAGMWRGSGSGEVGGAGG